MGYVKLHDQIFTSSIIEEDVIVRWIWIAMLLSCDRNGNIHGTTAALSRKANVSETQFTAALKTLMSSDPNSTSKEEDGRRITSSAPNQYYCVNYQYYRGMKDPVEEREKGRLRVAKHREKKRLETKCNTGNATVTKSNPIAEAEAEAEAEADIHARKNEIPFDDFWSLYPRKVGGKKAKVVWRNVTIKKQQAAMAALPTHIESWKGKDPKFIPHPTTWINQERWEDELSTKPVDNEWIYDTYRRTDMVDHSNSTLWEEYIEDAATHSPREAPTFGEWLDAQN